MLEDILQYDNQIIIFLNSLGSKTFDGFWLTVTNPLFWFWLPILCTYFLLRSYKLKIALKFIVLATITCLVTLVLVELIKRNVARFRPIDNHQIKHLLRMVTDADNFSFVSGHSAFSMTFAYLAYKILQYTIKHIVFIFIFPLLFAYSRLYLGVHFLTDIVSGLLLGFLIANLGWYVAKKYILDNPTNR